MSATSKSTNLGLSLWQPSDRPERIDFFNDNRIIDKKLGGHINDMLLHLTANEKAFVQNPFKINLYYGDGKEMGWNYAPYQPPRLVIAMCCEMPPVVPGEDGKLYVYWDFWSNWYTDTCWGLGGVKMNEDNTRILRYSKPSETNEKLVYKMNEAGLHYLYLSFPIID